MIHAIKDPGNGGLAVTVKPGMEHGFIVGGNLLVWATEVKGKQARLATHNFDGFTKIVRVGAIAKRLELTPEEVLGRILNNQIEGMGL